MSTSLSGHYEQLYQEGQPSWENAKSAFRELKAICDERDIALAAFLIPDLHDFSEASPFLPLYEIVGDAFGDAGINYVSTYPALRATFGDRPSTAWIAEDDAHPSAEAHRVVAEELFRYIADKIP